MGLANRVVPAGQALAAAQELAAQLASLPQTCLRSDRASVLDQEGLDETAALASEFAHGQEALADEAAIRGAARFAAGARRHGSPPSSGWRISLLERKPDTQRRSLSGRAGDVDRPPERLDAVGQADQPGTA